MTPLISNSEKGVRTLQDLETIRQKTEIEDFVYDFLNIWIKINERAKKASIDQIYEIAADLLKTDVLHFYEKYHEDRNLIKHDGWLKSYASITLKWGNRANLLFPLKLVCYEIAYHQRGLLDEYISLLMTHQMQGKQEDLYEFLFPLLTNFVTPLDELSLNILKAFNSLPSIEVKDYYQDPSRSIFAEHLETSLRTVIRRMSTIELLQMVNSTFFIDMGKLGYETSLLVHSKPFPREYSKYLLLSTDLTVGKFSIIQIPIHSIQDTLAIQEKVGLIINQPILRRTSNWNLSGLSSGETLWKKPPGLFHTDPRQNIIGPSPIMDMTLEPKMDQFRPLTPSDLKILDFLTTSGTFRSIKQLSKAIKVSVSRISQNLKEYTDTKLFSKVYQYFNLGLDLSIFFFISDEEKQIPWIQHFLAFPKVDVFFQEEETPHYYFGYVKLPNKWIKPFVRKVDLIRRDFGTKIYYKIYGPTDFFKWGVSLKDTYRKR
ncbi:MAG: hypothetical protein ACW964_08935 [Candidatus Hodarchaeales archaeon]|jgi:DNA-binding Lrp family transcriptional regulator